MASLSPSSSTSPIKKHDVFLSFHGPDVRTRFLSHLIEHFKSKGIIAFKDQEIERGKTIGPELVKGIRESRVSMVVLSKNYASSSWCLDELVEILKYKKESEQIVITIFYDVDPSDVRKQKGDFGEAFEKTCEGKKDELKKRWTEDLTAVANIEGEHSLNWPNEAEMIQTITKDISDKLNVPLPSDVKLRHLCPFRKLHSLLCLDECANDVKMIGIQGCARIGKTSLALAVYEQLSRRFELKCYMGNLKDTCKHERGSDDSKLSMQTQLLCEIFNQKDMKIHNLRAIEERLRDQKVLIFLDHVDHIKQLQTLAKELSWFGPGSRIIVITENKKILKKHKIGDIYHMSIGTHIASYVKAACSMVLG